MAKRLETLYLDTAGWNALLDQQVTQQPLEGILSAKHTQLVISTQLVYELAKTYQSPRTNAPKKARALFQVLKQYVDARIPCLKMNSHLLLEEARRAHGEISRPAIYLGHADYEKLQAEVVKLTAGEFDPRADRFITERRSQAQAFRTEAAQFLATRPELTAQLRNAGLATVLPRDSKRHGHNIIASHLAHEMPSADRKELRWIAKKLAANPKYRVSQTMIRADIYVNWRVARSGSLARDVQDDCYHLVSAAYCDYYVTRDQQQRDYAPLVLPKTTCLFYEGGQGFLNWLADQL